MFATRATAPLLPRGGGSSHHRTPMGHPKPPQSLISLYDARKSTLYLRPRAAPAEIPQATRTRTRTRTHPRPILKRVAAAVNAAAAPRGGLEELLAIDRCVLQPGVRFSPPSALTRTYTTHAPDAYDRSPLLSPQKPARAESSAGVEEEGEEGEDEEARARLRLLDEFPTPPTVERFCESAGPPVVALATAPSCNDVFAALSNAGTSPPERRAAMPMPVRPRRPSCGSMRLPCNLDRPLRPPPPPDLGLRDQLAQENRSRRRVASSYHPALPPPPPNKRIEAPLEPPHPFRARCMARDDWDAFLPVL